ncbi:hypothetical protein DID75_02570 [Candidatus Marinamargulisbacteria bacterium SCGC AG-410-N11]|nr:hypothetical protein DID75_02570 [Candidatus Marinamargulisbacteria bacterium SCGC AG-410-N11]
MELKISAAGNGDFKISKSDGGRDVSKPGKKQSKLTSKLLKKLGKSLEKTITSQVLNNEILTENGTQSTKLKLQFYNKVRLDKVTPVDLVQKHSQISNELAQSLNNTKDLSSEDKHEIIQNLLKDTSNLLKQDILVNATLALFNLEENAEMENIIDDAKNRGEVESDAWAKPDIKEIETQYNLKRSNYLKSGHHKISSKSPDNLIKNHIKKTDPTLFWTDIDKLKRERVTLELEILKDESKISKVNENGEFVEDCQFLLDLLEKDTQKDIKKFLKKINKLKKTEKSKLIDYLMNRVNLLQKGEQEQASTVTIDKLLNALELLKPKESIFSKTSELSKKINEFVEKTNSHLSSATTNSSPNITSPSRSRSSFTVQSSVAHSHTTTSRSTSSVEASRAGRANFTTASAESAELTNSGFNNPIYTQNSDSNISVTMKSLTQANQANPFIEQSNKFFSSKLVKDISSQALKSNWSNAQEGNNTDKAQELCVRLQDLQAGINSIKGDDTINVFKIMNEKGLDGVIRQLGKLQGSTPENTLNYGDAKDLNGWLSQWETCLNASKSIEHDLEILLGMTVANATRELGPASPPPPLNQNLITNFGLQSNPHNTQHGSAIPPSTNPTSAIPTSAMRSSIPKSLTVERLQSELQGGKVLSEAETKSQIDRSVEHENNIVILKEKLSLIYKRSEMTQEAFIGACLLKQPEFLSIEGKSHMSSEAFKKAITSSITNIADTDLPGATRLQRTRNSLIEIGENSEKIAFLLATLTTEQQSILDSPSDSVADIHQVQTILAKIQNRQQQLENQERAQEIADNTTIPYGLCLASVELGLFDNVNNQQQTVNEIKKELTSITTPNEKLNRLYMFLEEKQIVEDLKLSDYKDIMRTLMKNMTKIIKNTPEAKKGELILILENSVDVLGEYKEPIKKFLKEFESKYLKKQLLKRVRQLLPQPLLQAADDEDYAKVFKISADIVRGKSTLKELEEIISLSKNENGHVDAARFKAIYNKNLAIRENALDPSEPIINPRDWDYDITQATLDFFSNPPESNDDSETDRLVKLMIEGEDVVELYTWSRENYSLSKFEHNYSQNQAIAKQIENQTLFVETQYDFTEGTPLDYTATKWGAFEPPLLREVTYITVSNQTNIEDQFNSSIADEDKDTLQQIKKIKGQKEKLHQFYAYLNESLNLDIYAKHDRFGAPRLHKLSKNLTKFTEAIKNDPTKLKTFKQIAKYVIKENILQDDGDFKDDFVKRAFEDAFIFDKPVRFISKLEEDTRFYEKINDITVSSNPPPPDKPETLRTKLLNKLKQSPDYQSRDLNERGRFLIDQFKRSQLKINPFILMMYPYGDQIEQNVMVAVDASVEEKLAEYSNEIAKLELSLDNIKKGMNILLKGLTTEERNFKTSLSGKTKIELEDAGIKEPLLEWLIKEIIKNELPAIDNIDNDIIAEHIYTGLTTIAEVKALAKQLSGRELMVYYIYNIEVRKQALDTNVDIDDTLTLNNQLDKLTKENDEESLILNKATIDFLRSSRIIDHIKKSSEITMEQNMSKSKISLESANTSAQKKEIAIQFMKMLDAELTEANIIPMLTSYMTDNKDENLKQRLAKTYSIYKSLEILETLLDGLKKEEITQLKALSKNLLDQLEINLTNRVDSILPPLTAHITPADDTPRNQKSSPETNRPASFDKPLPSSRTKTPQGDTKRDQVARPQSEIPRRFKRNIKRNINRKFKRKINRNRINLRRITTLESMQKIVTTPNAFLEIKDKQNNTYYYTSKPDALINDQGQAVAFESIKDNIERVEKHNTVLLRAFKLGLLESLIDNQNQPIDLGDSNIALIKLYNSDPLRYGTGWDVDEATVQEIGLNLQIVAKNDEQNIQELFKFIKTTLGLECEFEKHSKGLLATNLDIEKLKRNLLEIKRIVKKDRLKLHFCEKFLTEFILNSENNLSKKGEIIEAIKSLFPRINIEDTNRDQVARPLDVFFKEKTPIEQQVQNYNLGNIELVLNEITDVNNLIELYQKTGEASVEAFIENLNEYDELDNWLKENQPTITTEQLKQRLNNYSQELSDSIVNEMFSSDTKLELEPLMHTVTKRTDPPTSMSTTSRLNEIFGSDTELEHPVTNRRDSPSSMSTTSRSSSDSDSDIPETIRFINSSFGEYKHTATYNDYYLTFTKESQGFVEKMTKLINALGASGNSAVETKSKEKLENLSRKVLNITNQPLTESLNKFNNEEILLFKQLKIAYDQAFPDIKESKGLPFSSTGTLDDIITGLNRGIDSESYRNFYSKNISVFSELKYTQSSEIAKARIKSIASAVHRFRVEGGNIEPLRHFLEHCIINNNLSDFLDNLDEETIEHLKNIITVYNQINVHGNGPQTRENKD